jgi:hypothetical protein
MSWHAPGKVIRDLIETTIRAFPHVPTAFRSVYENGIEDSLSKVADRTQSRVSTVLEKAASPTKIVNGVSRFNRMKM